MSVEGLDVKAEVEETTESYGGHLTKLHLTKLNCKN